MVRNGCAGSSPVRTRIANEKPPRGAIRVMLILIKLIKIKKISKMGYVYCITNLINGK